MYISEKKAKNMLYQFLVFFFGFTSLIFILFSYLKIQFFELCFPFTVFVFVINLFLFRNRQPILFIDFYIFIYFLYLFYYFYQGAHISEHTLYQEKYLFERVCLFFYLFYYSQFCIYKIYKKQTNHIIIRNKKIIFSNIEIIILLIFIFGLLCVTYRIGTDMIRTGFNYRVYIENLKASSVIPALFIIVFALYAFSQKANRFICCFFCLAYLYFCISRGFRITALPAILVIYLAFYEGKIPNILFLICLFSGLAGIIVLGELKDSGSVNFSKMFDAERGGVIISHHADILYTMTATIGLVENGIVDALLRLELGVSFFLQAFFLPSFFPDTLRYPLVVSYFTVNGGGGFFLAGAYLFWGVFGVFICSYIINLLIVKAYDTKSIYFQLAITIVLVFSCNWISYDFHTILRFPMYTLIVYWLLTHIDWRYLKNENSIGCFSY